MQHFRELHAVRLQHVGLGRAHSGARRMIPDDQQALQGGPIAPDLDDHDEAQRAGRIAGPLVADARQGCDSDASGNTRTGSADRYATALRQAGPSTGAGLAATP